MKIIAAARAGHYEKLDFEMPGNITLMFRMPPGQVDPDPSAETLASTRSMTTRRCALHAVSLRLGQVIRERCVLRTATSNVDTEFLHGQGTVVQVMAKDVVAILVAGNLVRIQCCSGSLERLLENSLRSGMASPLADPLASTMSQAMAPHMPKRRASQHRGRSHLRLARHSTNPPLDGELSIVP